ncbi:MAG: HAMP domain-containing sensor histidine kinase [Acidobacteriota bacterium]|nr:HAMP domain-containing sensor histidine kinase [Acidobacteriota bacterium]
MAIKLPRSLAPLGIIAGLSALLVVLGILQFRWSNQVRTAELERKQAALQAGMNGFREDFRRELAGVCTSFTIPRPDETPDVEDIYAQDCGDWGRSSDHRELVANFYLWEKDKGNSYSFLQFNPQEETFTATACPARLGALCDSSILVAPQSNRGGDLGGMSLRWRVQGATLAMVRPIFLPGWRNRRNRSERPPDPSPVGLMVVELNRDVFQRFLLELAQRYFGGTDGPLYNVAVVDGANPPHFIFHSQYLPSPNLVSSPDETLLLFNPRRPRGYDFRQGNPGEPGDTARRDRMAPRFPFPGGGPDFPARARGFIAAPILADASAAGWRLLVRHPGGSLADAVAKVWRRDLLLGFGVLLVLAASVALVLIWTQRIRRLAKMQMDFVTGVSHELRTPVSVISSAAENLADGVVDAKPQVMQYGTLIRNETHRLAAMIEQVLLFAATRNGKQQYEPRPVPVAETIDSAVAELSHLTSANGFTVEKEVTPGLPAVMADPKALGRCLQNLMTNALKYGAGGRWMAVRAQPGSGAEAGEVLITVQDRGQGIEASEISHIFEPFYRGNAARASQTRRTGLGLSLAKEAAEAMGGKLTVASRVGEGSAFTLHFPAAK